VKEFHVIALSANNWETGTFRVLDSTTPSLVNVTAQTEMATGDLLIHIYWQPTMPSEHEQWHGTIKEVVEQHLSS